MENKKINITEVLKYCPIGMELYSPIFGNVYLDKIRPHLAIVVTTDKEQGNIKEEFLYDGRYGMNGECMLFPSKDKTTWEGFEPPCEFKDGDIVYFMCNCGDEYAAIFKKMGNKYLYTYIDFNCGSFTGISESLFEIEYIKEVRLATKEEKRNFFDVIKENGYHWNAETKTLEYLFEPKFKVGNVIKDKVGHNVKIIQVNIDKECYVYITEAGGIGDILFKYQDSWELVPDKFDISTLVPFESRVLVRHTKDEIWKPAIFGCYTGYRYYVLGNVHWVYCIPYEGNEHLCGKIDDCDEYYKTWKS